MNGIALGVALKSCWKQERWAFETCPGRRARSEMIGHAWRDWLLQGRLCENEALVHPISLTDLAGPWDT